LNCHNFGRVYAYSAYGEATALGPDGGNSLQYTGRENDGSGLYYYRARYYDPVLKRFVSEDPISLQAGPNFYAYVENSPLNFADPSGLLVGSGLARIFGRLVGRTPDEVGYIGKLFDVGIGAASGNGPRCIGGVDVSGFFDALRGAGGAQAISLSTATTFGLYGAGATIGSATASVALPVALAAYGGFEVGATFNSVYERSRGNSLGGDIYDLIHQRRLYNYQQPSSCSCQ